MKRFVAIYLGTKTGPARAQWDKLDDATRKQREAEGMKAWMQWGEKNASAIADAGSPLGKTKRAARDGIADTTNNVVAYAIVQAESHEAAAQLFANHPHFSIFPGDAVEIMECLPLPAR